jgi:hypothetical protein
MKHSTLLGATVALALAVACGAEVVPIASDDATEAARAAPVQKTAERVTCLIDASATVDGSATGDALPDRAPSDDASAQDADPTRLAWHATCGTPVCRPPGDDAPPATTCAAEGTPCGSKGETCGDGTYTCGSIMVCDDHDPKIGGCPISSAKFKEAIHYLNDAELARLHDETLDMRLTTYRYSGDGSKHLGFIVEDQPESMSVDRGHDRVDLYGYLSMVVATLKVQEEEIRALKAECKKR